MMERANHGDEIWLWGVQVSARIGVPEEERRLPQTLELDLGLVPAESFENLEDELERTIDYERVWRRAREIAVERPRKLIETLADELAWSLLREFGLREVSVELRKSVLPGTSSVSVRVRRRRERPD